MRKAWMGFLFLTFMLALSATYCPAYDIKGSIEGIYLIRPESKYIDWNYVPSEYISVEDLVYYACIEEQGIPIKTSVLCVDDNSFTDINMYKFSDTYNCYIGAYNLEEKHCRDVRVLLHYVKDGETFQREKKIKVNRLSSMLDYVAQTQYSDGGWRDAIETSGGIWVLSNYKDIYAEKLELAMQWLKLNRDNQRKCWPQEDCSTFTTAKIMAYLTLSGYPDTYRVIYDGVVFLEKEQNYFVDTDEWTLRVFPFEPYNTSCIINYNRSYLNNESFWVMGSSSATYTITPVENQKLDVVCDRNIRANLSTKEGETVFIYEGDNMSYTMPDHCWSKDQKWGACDVATTAFAVISNISQEKKDAALRYLVHELRNERSGEKYLGADANISNTALFLYSGYNSSVVTNLTNISDVISWLRYKQNNNGSWGNGSTYKMIYPTAYSILGLMAAGFNRTHEVIDDAEDWVVGEELAFAENIESEYVGWNNTEMNALAFIVLKNNARPILKSRPMIVIMDKESVPIEVYNPTTFPLTDVTYEFSDELKDVLDIEKKRTDISPYSYIRLNLIRKTAETGNIYGHLSIYNLGDETGRIPIIVTSHPKIEISLVEKSLTVFGTTAKINFNIAKTGHPFSCRLRWDDEDITSQSDFTITGNSLSVEVSFNKAERAEKTYKGRFECTAADQSFVLPFSIHISRYSTFPFTVSPSEIFVNSTDNQVFFVKNRLDESIEVTVDFAKKQAFFSFSQSTKILDPNEEANFTIINTAKNENVTESTQIEIIALGQKKTIPFRVDIEAIPEKKMSPIVFWGIIGTILAILAGAGVLGYKYRKEIISFVKKGSKVDILKVKIKKLEEKEKQTAIANMVKILRMLKKDDLAIRKRLKDEGFSDKEIDDALAEQMGEEGKSSYQTVEEGLYSGTKK
ncbi:MAG: hypothetical protein QXK37_01915 [Candidatus Woesearchaeota archaeon]